MVFCKIISGLGNQLFQYAAARALATRLGTKLKLETSFYSDNPCGRTYELDRFNIQADVQTPFETQILRQWARPKITKIANALDSFGLATGLTVLHDRQKGFDDRISTVKGNVYLQGYWQSEQYFKPIASDIRQDFKLKQEPASSNSDMLKTIFATESIALHVRRGDYVTNKADSARLGTCSLDYYANAISRLNNKVSNPHFFIFSDDMNWTRVKIKTNHPTTFVTHNTGRQDFEDLRLMSSCKHFIIANSSFSWWGAWLSGNPNKQVIAPRRWFADPASDNQDIIPPGWITL